MKVTVTRTLQVPQFAPVVISLEKECSDDDYDATMDFLANAIENKLRERYPDFAAVLPSTEKKIPQHHTVENIGFINKETPPKIDIMQLIKESETPEELESLRLLATSAKALEPFEHRMEELSK